MFDLEQFIMDCREHAADSAHIRELLTGAVSEPAPLIRTLGEPTQAGVTRLHHGAGLTILNVRWAPGMTLKPHNHNMWAVVGVYMGREENIFWRRVGPRGPAAGSAEIEAADARSLSKGVVHPLGRDIIHSVHNPLQRITGAIHIYGGDFFNAARSEWDSEELREQPYDVEENMRRLASHT